MNMEMTTSGSTVAHCGVSNGTDFCTECSGPALCPINDICYCSSECFHSGQCCPDVEHLLTCLGGCVTLNSQLTYINNRETIAKLQ